MTGHSQWHRACKKQKKKHLCVAQMLELMQHRKREKTLGDAEEVIYLTCINFHRLSLHLDHFHRAGPHVFHQALNEVILEPWDRRLFCTFFWEVKSRKCDRTPNTLLWQLCFHPFFSISRYLQQITSTYTYFMCMIIPVYNVLFIS